MNGVTVLQSQIAALEAELAREREARESETRERFQAAYAKANIAEALRQRDEAEGRVRDLQEKARYAKTVAAAPDYDEEAIRDALWAVVDEALVGLPER